MTTSTLTVYGNVMRPVVREPDDPRYHTPVEPNVKIMLDYDTDIDYARLEVTLDDMWRKIVQAVRAQAGVPEPTPPRPRVPVVKPITPAYLYDM